MLWQRIKYFFATALSLAIALVCAPFVWGTGATRFPALEGERTYYLYSKSSQATIKTTLSLLDCGNVKGESVRFLKTENWEKRLEELCAQVLFTEDACGVRSYYCYTPKWSDGVRLGEYFVNLHIAVRGEEVTVGAPVIFGGF